MFEPLRSPKTRGVIQAPPTALLFLSGSHLSTTSRQSCAVSLRNAASLGFRLGRADAPVNVKASTDSAYAHGCICIPVSLLIARRR